MRRVRDAPETNLRTPKSVLPGLNTIDPIAYAFRALIPLHFHCEGGVAAGCPTLLAPNDSQVLTLYDRSTFVESTYEVSHSAIWACIGYTALFIVAFQALNILSTYRVRHISR